MMRATLAGLMIVGALALQGAQSSVANEETLGQIVLLPTATRTPTPTATRTTTPTALVTTTTQVCPAVIVAPSVLLSTPRMFQGDSLIARGRGFLGDTTVLVRILGPTGTEDRSTNRSDQCGEVLGTITTNISDRPGVYRVIMEGSGQVGQPISPSAEFEVVERGTPASTATPAEKPTVTPGASPTTTPTIPAESRPAPLDLSQSLQPTRPDAVPVQGQPFGWRHVVRVANTSRASVEFKTAAVGSDISPFRLGLLAQGEPVTVSYSTEYSEDVRFTSTSASSGQVTVRGASLVWEGRLGPGESVDLIATFDQTPTQALVFSNPVRGQSLVVSDARGVNLVVPAPAPPLPPPAHRFVQPPPPPVDPASGPRFFPETGFAVVDDSIWVYYHRRGGQRTFGPPISRLMRVNGAWVQLFEKGMLETREGGIVVAPNLLEPPFLPYQNLGDVLLPAVDDDLVLNAPQPDQPDFGGQAQEFVRANSPESFENLSTRFYSTFLGTVRFHDAFFDGRGDPNLVPGFNLEIWGLPRSRPSLFATGPEQIDPSRAVALYQRGVMVHDSRAGTTTPLPLGYYLRSILVGDDSLPALAEAAAQGPLWGQYDPDAAGWLARPDELPETNLVLAFTREDDLGEAVAIRPRRRWIQVLEPTLTYTDAGELLGTAAAGEWYRVTRREDGWALAVWELDPPESAVWIIVDERVRMSLE